MMNERTHYRAWSTENIESQMGWYRREMRDGALDAKTRERWNRHIERMSAELQRRKDTVRA
jgi:hypothetical protein